MHSHNPMSETSLPISVPFLVRSALVFIGRRSMPCASFPNIFFIFGGQCHTFFYYFISQICIETSTYILHTVILLGGCMVIWTWGGLESCLFWSCFDVIVVKVKAAEELCHSPHLGSTVRTIINRPMGRFARTNHIYFQITQPGSSTVTLLYL